MTTTEDYFAGDVDLYEGRTRLCFVRDPARRAGLLVREAEVCEHRAALHVAVFGDDPDRDEPDAVSAEFALAYSARLLRIVANAEQCRADGGFVPCGDPLEEPVLAVLHLWARGLPRRELIGVLCDAWYPLVGSQAVEVIYTLPLGWSWLRGAGCALGDARQRRVQRWTS